MKPVGLIVTLLASLVPALAAEQRFADLGECRVDSGAAIEDCRIGYRTFGSLNRARDNAILVPTWHTGTSENHEYMVDPRFLDPERYFVVIVDALANGVSSSPSNSRSQGNGAFPAITVRDMVRSQHRLATEVLGLKSLHAVIGASMGGMQAFDWSVAYPGFAKKTVAAIGTPRLASFDIVLWETQIRLLELYRSCECAAAEEALVGMRLLSRDPARLSTDIEAGKVDEVLEQGARSRALTVPGSWDIQRQAEAMIGHDISRGFGNDLSAAARATKTEYLIVVGAGDRIVTPEPALAFAELVGIAPVVLDGGCGHAAPWCEAELYAGTIKSFLD